MSSPNYSSVADILQKRAEQQPAGIAYRYLVNGEDQKEEVTYRRLHEDACALAVRMLALAEPGDRALLLFPSGLDFIRAFFGCLYAGITAVAAYPPRRNKPSVRIERIIEDCSPKLILTLGNLLGQVEPLAAGRTVVITDGETECRELRSLPDVSGRTTALLQYTSGSTAHPKGVILSNAAILANAEFIATAFENSESDIGVGWLPLFHDMGLIGNVLQSLYVGIPVTMMSPTHFLQKPRRWLQAISDHRATASGGPSFAYDLCVDKIPPAERAGLDLSSWRVAFCGAEMVRPRSLERFYEAFKHCGFRWESFLPCYGLAETTLFASGLKSAPGPQIFEHENKRVYQGCGRPHPATEVRVVDAEAGREVPDGQIGEIWIAGDNVASGYWNNPQATREAFGATLKGSARQFLRTGDLGFKVEGQLVLTGRLKNVLIVRGKKHAPEDLEDVCMEAHPACERHASVVFQSDQDRIIAVQEIQRGYKGSLAEVVVAIRESISNHFELSLHAVLLVRVFSIPRTSSGKAMRHESRRFYETSAFDCLYKDERGVSELRRGRSRRDLIVLMKARIASIAGFQPETIDSSQTIAEFGLSPSQLDELKAEVRSISSEPLPLAGIETSTLLEVVDAVLSSAREGLLA